MPVGDYDTARDEEISFNQTSRIDLQDTDLLLLSNDEC
jgi:hypothetical protein